MDSLPSDIRQQLIKLQDDRLPRKLKAAGYTVENAQKMNRGELQDAYAPIFLTEQQPQQPPPAVDTNPNIETDEVFETDTEDLTREKLERFPLKLHGQQIELEKFRLRMEHESREAIEQFRIRELELQEAQRIREMEMEAQSREAEREAQREQRSL